MFQLYVWYSKLRFDGKESILMKNLGSIPVGLLTLILSAFPLSPFIVLTP